jgi:hypothetical protein
MVEFRRSHGAVHGSPCGVRLHGLSDPATCALGLSTEPRQAFCKGFNSHPAFPYGLRVADPGPSGAAPREVGQPRDVGSQGKRSPLQPVNGEDCPEGRTT